MNMLSNFAIIAITVGSLWTIDRAMTAHYAQKQFDLQTERHALLRQKQSLNERVASLSSLQSEGGLPAELSLSAERRQDAEVRLQQQITDLARQNNLILSNFSPTIVTRDTMQSTVGFELEAEANYADLLSFLADLQRATPSKAIGSLWIRQIPAAARPEMQTPVYIRTSVWMFWQQPDGTN